MEGTISLPRERSGNCRALCSGRRQPMTRLIENKLSPGDLRLAKAYTIPQAARLAGISTSTANRWLTVSGWDPSGEPYPMLSFLELIELVVVARFRRPPAPMPFARIAEAHAFAKKEFGLPYPFATEKLLRLGGHVLHRLHLDSDEKPRDWTAIDMDGHHTLPGLVQAELELNVSYPDEFAGVWYPRGREVPIVVDPRIAGGRPSIEGHGITVETLRRRWQAGESPSKLALDYGLTRHVVEQVVQVARTAA